MKCHGLLLVVISGVLVTACRDGSLETRVFVELPGLPPALALALVPVEWRLRTLDADGTVAERRFDPSVRAVEVTVPRYGTTPVVAEMTIGGAASGRLVCGALSPYDEAVDGVLALEWEEGMLSIFLLDYFAATGDPMWFDLAKLREAIDEETGGNPWNLDREALAVAFSWYSLSRSAIREARRCDLTGILEEALPRARPETRWRWVDPVEPAPIRGRCTVSPGLHSIVDEATGDTAELYVGRGEWTLVVNRDPETARSGIW